MVQMDALQLAAGAYTAQNWGEGAWRQFGRETGTSDILSRHSRLYRSQDFGDDDYPDAALEVLGWVLAEAHEVSAGEKGRMDLLADSMPNLPTWTEANAPARTKRLLREYLAARDVSEIPEQWRPINSDGGAAEISGSASGSIISDQAPWETMSIPTSTEIYDPFPWNSTAQDAPARLASVDDLAQTGGEVGSAAGGQRSVFIVHGHDEAAMNSVRTYVARHTNSLPVSLAEEPGRGRTIIEKFEDIGDNASYVIVLLTPDDVGQTVGAHTAGNEPAARARQNVVLELGYFIGKLGRQNVVVLDATVERPSDLAGLSYIAYPGQNWKDDLREELVAAGVLS